jgi:hypothetical protein
VGKTEHRTWCSGILKLDEMLALPQKKIQNQRKRDEGEHGTNYQETAL